MWIYEVLHAPHESAAREVIFQLWMRQMGQHMNDIDDSGSPRCDNHAGGWSYEPDASLTVGNGQPGRGHADAADIYGNRWPNIIVEVALTESETHVRARAMDWLETATDADNGVQQVIVIKIGTTPRVDGHRTMKAWRYERNAAENPVQTIEFGIHGPRHGAT
jgi:hypothetical protein